MSAQVDPHLRPFFSFLDDFNRETERGAALAAAAMIDELLATTLKSFLVENEGSKRLFAGENPPFGTFASRMSAAFALGLINQKEFDECSTIRKIRNEFAHAVKVSFADPKIKNLCEKLTMAAKNYNDVVVDSRGKFTTSAVAVILNLTNRPHYVGFRRLKSEEWPY